MSSGNGKIIQIKLWLYAAEIPFDSNDKKHLMKMTGIIQPTSISCVLGKLDGKGLLQAVGNIKEVQSAGYDTVWNYSLWR